MTSDTDYASEAVDRLQPRIPASLYEVAWQYTLFDWYASMQSGEIDFDFSAEHLAYLTPRAQSDLFGQEDSLVVVSVDLSNPDAPKLAEGDDGPVEIMTYTETDRFRVGHSYPANKTSSMTDYSITTQKTADAHHIAGLRDDAWGTNNVQDRFTDWAQSDYAEAVKERADPEDAAILDGLAALGDDEDAMDRLAEALLAEAGGEDVEIDALITVRIKLPGKDEFRYPGEIPILNEVMVEKKAERLESISVEEASGEGVGYLSDGEETSVTGGSPGLFGLYGKKQREHFPDLDHKGSSAWRTRPLQFDVAAAVATADSVFEDFYRGIGNNRRLYVLPYLACRAADCSADTIEWFYTNVFEPLRRADDDFEDRVDNVMRSVATAGEPDDSDDPFSDVGKDAAWDRVRVASVHMVSGNPDRVFFDTLDATSRPAQLDDVHNRVASSFPFHGDGIFAERPDASYSPLLGTNLVLHRYILYGRYFSRTSEPTRSSKEASETPTAGDIDDYRMQRVKRLLTDGELVIGDLLEDYLHKIVQEQHEAFGSDEEYTPVPVRSIVEQYVQLHALEAAGALEATRGTAPSFTITTPEMSKQNTHSSRDDRLEAFLDSHGALSEQHHRATFLLGALVGRVTAYQTREGVSSTLVRRYPIDYLTKQTVKEVTKEVLQQDSEYAEAEDRRSYWTNSRYTTRLVDTMLSADPAGWPISDAELQWLYGLGIAYGLNDTGLDHESDEAAPEQEVPLADDS